MATIADVARRAGVAPSTVSYALSGRRTISAETRARIEAAMSDLDFTPNAFARALKSRRSRILAYLVPTDVNATDPYTTALLFAAAERARVDGYHLLLWTESEGESVEVRDLVRDGLVDGAIVASITVDDERVAALLDASVPLVTIGRTDSLERLAFVDTDEQQTAQLTIERLHDLGHRSVVFLGPPESEYARRVAIVTRLDVALESAAAAAGMAFRAVHCDFDAAAAADVVASELRASRPTAFVVLNRPALPGVLAGVQAAGLEIPLHVSVVALLSTGDDSTTTVASISTDPVELGSAATDILIAMLEDRPTNTQRLFPSRFKAGQSLAGPGT